MDTAELKKGSVVRVFRAWLEDWEEDMLRHDDPVAEARLLEKYKNLVFFDPDTQTTFTIHDKNLEYHRKKRRGGLMVDGR